MKKFTATIHVALPVMNESEFIGSTLSCLKNQSHRDFHTWICVNQPENYWENPKKAHICYDNTLILNTLKNYPLANLHVLDFSSRGHGWKSGKCGVGMARKVLLDVIMSKACDNDIIVSLDADTTFGVNYLSSVLRLFDSNPHAVGLANPYYHNLVADESLNRAILRYEIYMRYYALNMRFTGSPYCFTALGSAMALPVWACKKIGGLTPKTSGEDFYFLQKLTKVGKILMYNPEIIYPGTRLSDRVVFGTGPALIKGLAGQWESYPIFRPELFGLVKQTIDLFPLLYQMPSPTPFDNFLASRFGTENIFDPLRKNHKTIDNFIKACHEKIDGLRILQFLKYNHFNVNSRDEKNLKIFLESNFDTAPIKLELNNLDFAESPVQNINKIRNFLFQTELKIQSEYDRNNQKPI